MRVRILFLGRRKLKNITMNPEKVSLLVTIIPFLLFWKVNMFRAENPFFLADHTMCSRGFTSSILIVAFTRNTSGRKQQEISPPQDKHFSFVHTSSMMVFHSFQQVRLVKVSQTLSIFACMRIDSSITILD